MRTIYSQTGKRTTATEEDAEAMIQDAGYSADWPPAIAPDPQPAIESAVETEAKDTESGEQSQRDTFSTAVTGTRFRK